MVLPSLLVRDETTCWRRPGEKVPRVSIHAAEELEWSRRWVVRACIAIYFYSHVALVCGPSGVRIRGVGQVIFRSPKHRIWKLKVRRETRRRGHVDPGADRRLAESLGSVRLCWIGGYSELGGLKQGSPRQVGGRSCR